MRALICLFLILCGCLWVGTAQGQQSISLRTLQLGGGEMPEAWVRVAKQEGPVRVSWLTRQPTEPLQALHQGSLKLLSFVTNTEGKRVVSEVTTVALPAGAREILLLGALNGKQAKYIAIEDRFLGARFNDWIAINTSATPVALKVGKKSSKPIRIEPGKSIIFKPDIEENKGVEMVAMAPRDDELKTFLSTYWPAFPGQRTMIVFYQDGERMRARRIGDRFLRKNEQE